MTTGRINQVARDEAYNTTPPHSSLERATKQPKAPHATPGIRHAADAAPQSIAGPRRRADRANSPEVQFRNLTQLRLRQISGRKTPANNQTMQASRNRTPSCKLTAHQSLGTRSRSRTSSDHSKESHQCSAMETRRHRNSATTTEPDQ